MNKEEIIALLNKYKFDKDEFVIISGAALVLLGVKDSTDDIDITVSEKLYNKLLSEYECIFEKNVGKYKVYFIDNVINFSENYFDKVECINYEGYKVQSLKSIYDLKLKLNRDKDKKDIEKIIKFIKLGG